MDSKLKTGIIISGSSVQAWVYKVIEDLVASDFAELALVIYCNDPNVSSGSSQNSEPLISRIHGKLDRLLFGKADSYDVLKDLSRLVNGINEIRVNTVRKSVAEEFALTDIAAIRKFNPDVILKFRQGLLTGEILKLPRYGVWGFSMDTCKSNPGGEAGYNEVISENPVTRAELLILRDPVEKSMPISTTIESTCSYSVHLNRNKLYWRASLFIPRIIEGICRYGSSYLELLKARNSGTTYLEDNKTGKKGNKATEAKPFIAVKLLIRKFLKKVFFTDPFSWILLYDTSVKKRFQDNSCAGYKKLKPAKNRFWADPFVVSADDKHYVFVEEFMYKKNRGHISVLELDKQGKLVKSGPVIVHPYHMSYPHVFNFEGSYYMIPETCENHTIDLYKSTEFPFKWTFVKHIMSDIEAMDSTLFNYRDKWWLFTLVERISFASDNSPELYIYYNDDFMSDKWISHPLNPVISDVRTARPAGNIFISDGALYRPSQDCSARYGQALNINEIMVLTETDYLEKEVAKVKPDWEKELKGLHTLNFSESFSVADAYYFRRRFI
ncbi:MAG TPA: hypothetical protein PLX08_05585 [Bacteroidales bacterium]|jgi:hypothetical protein|nr:hypothetical protein [Bacteroidales bacterium]